MTISPALIVVPARYGSTRLPGKPLLSIAGRTLLERVHAVASAAADL
ncbi:MAG TPA: 3-deoxy-manno-octulosonate cytidylyltransferase, partial [Burkholderiaceae bacterium]|nr:3-deoxy-manno-octulosonate cytidylyltransferase [Burkholderiaceae bacterium]